MDNDERKGLPSASQIQRILTCPASFKLESHSPKIDTEEARAGRVYHEILETGATEYAPEIDGGAIARARALVAPLEQNAEKSLKEIRLWSKSGKWSGRVDAMYFDTDKIDIVDFKFGVQPVPPAEINGQMAAYAVLVNENFGAEKIRVHIISPLVIGGEEYTVAEYTADEIQKAREKIEMAVDKALSDNPPFAKRTGTHCQFCQARGICPKQAENLENLTKESENMNTELSTGAGNALEITRENAFEMAMKIRKYKQARTQADKFAEMVEAKITEMLANGVEIEGLSLGAGRRVDTYDTQKTFDAVSQILSAERFLQNCKINKTGLLKELQLATGLSKKATEETFNRICEEVGAVSHGQGKPTLKL